MSRLNQEQQFRLETGHRWTGESRLPVIEEIVPCPDVFETLTAFADQPGILLFESTMQREHVGRYSFLMADPFQFYEIDQVKYGQDPFIHLQQQLQSMGSQHVDGIPPFQAGAAGLASYELGRCWERLLGRPVDEFEMPDLAVGLYDWVIAWDHQFNQAWVISQGYPQLTPEKRYERAARRLDAVIQTLSKKKCCNTDIRCTAAPLGRQQLTPQWATPGLDGLLSNFSRDDYLHTVERVIEHIYAGDIFQVNLSQRLLYPAQIAPLQLYGRLRRCNPAPFSAFFAYSDWCVVSASPERFVRVADREVETRPIKGTRKRRSSPEADLFTRDELRESEKDLAENVMIVDLLRNDLSRVCEPASIRIPNLCRVESYETVQHLVSEIRGTLTPRTHLGDLLKAVFPGGSITGAPKVRAMQIISELERNVRGPYCGSLFYMGYDGQMDSNILIRTFTARRGWIQCPVGGGIVAQSDPIAEHEETLAKAEGMLRALRHHDITD